MRHRRWSATIYAVTFGLILAAFPAWSVRLWFQHAQASYTLVGAVYNDDTKATISALRAGADPNTRRVTDDKPPTFTDIFRQIWQQLRGEKVSTPSDWDSHPSMIALAAQKENLTVVVALLTYGAVPDAYRKDAEHVFPDDETEGKTALMWAAAHNNTAMAKALLVKGANPNLNAGTYGEAPLLITTDPIFMETLLAHGANVHVALKHSKFAGITPLRYVVLNLVGSDGMDQPDHPRYYRCLESLLAHGADINENNSGENKGEEDSGYDNTALILATTYGTPADVRFVLAHGANPYQCDRNGLDALERAIEDGRTENIRVLLARGCDPNKRSKDGNMPLLLAVAHGEDGPVKVLLEAGANVNIHDAHDRTPLQLAQQDDNGTIETILRAADTKR